jgi:hypothetical protein
MLMMMTATKERVIQTFSKKSIEQLGVIKETNSLVSLSSLSAVHFYPLQLRADALFCTTDGTVSLHDIHTFELQTILGSNSLTKAQANLFALDTSIQASDRQLGSTTTAATSPIKGKGKGKEEPPTVQRRRAGKSAKQAEPEDTTKIGPVVVTTLAVACRRRLCLFHWRDGQWQEPKVGQLSSDASLV